MWKNHEKWMSTFCNSKKWIKFSHNFRNDFHTSVSSWPIPEQISMNYPNVPFRILSDTLMYKQSSTFLDRTYMHHNNSIVRALFLILLLFCSMAGMAQVTVEATLGTAGPTTYTNLRLAFDAINTGTHKGVIAIKINSSFTDNNTALLYGSATPTLAPNSSYTSSNIYPTTTGLSILGAVAAPLIDIKGADNVTIDGRVNAEGSDKSLTISNTSALTTAGTSTIRFINDASSNTVKYCMLKGSSTDAAAGIVFFSATTATTGNDNNTIDHNDITNASNTARPLNAVYALGTSTKSNSGNTISNNNFYDFLSKTTASNGINISSNNSAFTISGNSFYETASFTASGAEVAYNVILINAVTGSGNTFTVSGNYIGGNAALCAGTAWTKTAQNNAFTAISVTTFGEG